LTRSSAGAALYVFLLAVVVAFTILGVRRADGFHDDVNDVTSQGDDWLNYKRYAVSIVERGWTMPGAAGNYYRPAGFLYNYFVAAVFAIAGVNASYVYVAQSALLGLSVALMTVAFRPYLLPLSQWLLAVALAAAAYVDVFRNYTFRLLSENLLLVWLALFWLAFRVAERRREDAWPMLVCGALFGLCGLTRPNLIPAAAVLAVVMWKASGGFTGRAAWAFVLAFCAVTSFMLVRNYAVTGQVSLVALTGSVGWVVPKPADAVGHYARRLLFSLGFLPLLDSAYRIRPHWLLAWGGAAALVAMRWRALDLWESVALAFLAAYLVPMIAVAAIGNYGFRMLVPVMPLVVVLAVRAMDVRLRTYV